MLCYNRTDESEVIAPAKSTDSKECMVCHYWFFDPGFKFQGYVCNVCHDLNILLLSQLKELIFVVLFM